MKKILLAGTMFAALAAFASAQEKSTPDATEPAAQAQPSTDALPTGNEVSSTRTEQTTQQTTTTDAVPAAESKTTTTTTKKTTRVMGTVQTYEVGKSVTLLRSDGSTVTYVINDRSQLPADVAVGKKVTIVTTTGSSSQPVVGRMTYTTTTTTKKSVSPPR